ncbi:MADS-box transcription factor CDM44 [Tanacetum coccineum]
MVFGPNMTQMVDPVTALLYAVQVMNLLKMLITKALRERKLLVIKTNLLGKELGPFKCKELESLGMQLDTSLKHIISARTQLMLDTLLDLQKKVTDQHCTSSGSSS